MCKVIDTLSTPQCFDIKYNILSSTKFIPITIRLNAINLKILSQPGPILFFIPSQNDTIFL